LKASTSGVIKDVWTGPGDYVEVGAPRLSIVPNERQLLRLDVPISYYSQNHLIELLRWKQAGKWFEDSPEVVAFSPKVESGDTFYSILLKAQPLISLPGEFLEAELVLTSSNRENVVIPPRPVQYPAWMLILFFSPREPHSRPSPDDTSPAAQPPGPPNHVPRR